MQMINDDGVPNSDRPAPTFNPSDLPNTALMALTARWFEQLRTIRQRLQRWLPAVSGLPLWSFRAGDLMQTIDSLQLFLDDLADTIARLSNPRAAVSQAAVAEMEDKIAAATQIARRLENALAHAASTA